MNDSDPRKTQSVLVLNHPAHFQIFHDHLKNTLELLNCKSTHTVEWKEALEFLYSTKENYDMLVVDPFVEGFDERSFQEKIIRSPRFRSSKLVLIRYDLTDSLYQMEDRLDVDGMLAKTYTPHQIAFVINRLLFPGMDNRRLHARALAELCVSYQAGSDAPLRDVDTIDLSAGGIFVRSFKPLPVGEQVKLTVQIPSEAHPVRCNATVVHNRFYISGPEAILYPAGMGLQFEELMSSDRSRIFDFITTRLLRAERRATRRSLE